MSFDRGACWSGNGPPDDVAEIGPRKFNARLWHDLLIAIPWKGFLIRIK